MFSYPDPYAPVQPMRLKEIEFSDVKLFIKREDLSHPFISGNKWRKLKYHLIKAFEMNHTELVTFGGPYSNHLLATAAAGAEFGFKTTGVVRGERVSNELLKMCDFFGMNLRFISRSNYAQREEENGISSEYKHTYLIPEGGVGVLGEKGVGELINQLDQTFDHIVLAVGTGCSMRGLVSGIQWRNLHTKVHGIVVLKGAEAMMEQFDEFNPETFALHHRFHFGGYAKYTPGLVSFIKKIASQTGILTDHVYEAKMLYGVLSLIQEKYFLPGESVLAIHNGGLYGLSGLSTG